jgi:hypothetical protein
MSLRKKMTSKLQATEASDSDQNIEYETNTPRSMYDDASRLLEKEGDALIWGDMYDMLKN